MGAKGMQKGFQKWVQRVCEGGVQRRFICNCNGAWCERGAKRGGKGVKGGVKGDRSSRTISATSSSSTMASTASISYVHHNLKWHMSIYYFSITTLFRLVPGWSSYSRIPPAISTNSTLACTARTSLFVENSHGSCLSLFFKDKLI